jgi:hypothetical protein
MTLSIHIVLLAANKYEIVAEDAAGVLGVAPQTFASRTEAVLALEYELEPAWMWLEFVS